VSALKVGLVAGGICGWVAVLLWLVHYGMPWYSYAAIGFSVGMLVLWNEHRHAQ